MLWSGSALAQDDPIDEEETTTPAVDSRVEGEVEDAATVTVGAAVGDIIEEPETGFVPEPGLEHYISVSTKITQPVQRTPASVSVVTADEIERAGYRSVGEALESVPGLFVSYDLQNYHVGVRGVFGGARSGSRSIKVLVDGRTVAFVQSGIYLLGPELIPMSAIERIEIMRGPASALYGAGALIGAINIVTKRPPYEGEVTTAGDVRLYGGALGQKGGGLDGTVTVTGERFFGLVAVSGSYEDRSGLVVPPVSPFADNFTTSSEGDVARPSSVLGRLDAHVAGGRLSLMSLAQFSSRVAEFHDLTVLSHDTRVAIYNWNTHAQYEKPFASGLSMRLSGGLALAGPLDGDQFDLDPASGEFLRRNFKSRQITAAAELLKELGSEGLALLGVDASFDQEQTQQILRVQVDGTVIPEEVPPTHSLTNLAAYGQLLYPIGSHLALALGGRFDNHSVYGNAVTGRLGLVVRPTERLSLKLLVGRSYKAPSPEQLYGNRLSPGDIAGKEDIQPQFIQGVEGVIDYFIARWLNVSVDAYYNLSRDAIVYTLTAGQLVATPFDADTVGGEVTVRASRKTSGLTVDVGAMVGLQDTHTAESFVGGIGIKPVPDNEIFPKFMAGGDANLRLPDAHLLFHASFRRVGDRVPSQSNLRVDGVTDFRYPSYMLAAYSLLDASVSLTSIPVEGLGTASAMLRAENLLDERYSEIGFNGVDVPSIGRTLWLRLSLAF